MKDPSFNTEVQSRPGTVVYSNRSSLSNPFKTLATILRDLYKFRELIWILFTRDLRAQYRQTLFGYFWLFVPLLSTTIVWMFLSNTQVIQVAETPIPYPAYVMIGSLIWGVFIASVNQPLSSFNQGQGVFMKLKVPPEAFIFAGMSHVVFDTVIRSCVLVPVFFALGIVPASTSLLFPIGLLGAGLIGLSIGMLMIPISSLYTDASRFVSTGLQFGMYLTPIVYPAPKNGFASVLINANPLTHVVNSTRDWLTLGFSNSNVIFLLLVTFSCILLLTAMLILRVVLPHLIERMGM